MYRSISDFSGHIVSISVWGLCGHFVLHFPQLVFILFPMNLVSQLSARELLKDCSSDPQLSKRAPARSQAFQSQLHAGFLECYFCTHSGSILLCSASLQSATCEPLHDLNSATSYLSSLSEYTVLLPNWQNALLLYQWHLPFLGQIQFQILEIENAPTQTPKCPLRLSLPSEGDKKKVFQARDCTPLPISRVP